MKPQLTFIKKELFGKSWYSPACKMSRAICMISYKCSALTPAKIAILENAGFEIVIKTDAVVT